MKVGGSISFTLGPPPKVLLMVEIRGANIGGVGFSFEDCSFSLAISGEIRMI
jgi:hypothetical protein